MDVPPTFVRSIVIARRPSWRAQVPPTQSNPAAQSAAAAQLDRHPVAVQAKAPQAVAAAGRHAPAPSQLRAGTKPAAVQAAAAQEVLAA
jgi:hypothetical protein